MNTMNNIVTLRLSTPDIALLERLGKKEKKDRSTTLRDLVTKGRLYVAIEKYSTSEASLEKAAEIAGITVSQMMQLLERFGIETKLTLTDYFAGKAVAEKIV